MLWPLASSAQTAEERRNRELDIGIVIDNRPPPLSETARADVDALIRMLDRQMYIEHVMVLERPAIDVICDIFGCPRALDPDDRFPPLLWRITRQGKARIVVYYIGDGLAEGVQRKLLFARREGAAEGDVVGLSVDWLHRALAGAEPESAVLMLDTAFAPRPLPCASDAPGMIDDALFDSRRNYLRIARDHWNVTDNLELSATTPVQPSLCDRFDRTLDGLDQRMFTKFVLKGVVGAEADREPFGDGDELIELGELAAYLDDRISRAARFQWGRRQNVRAVGPGSRALASVEQRVPRQETADLLGRRNRPPPPSEAPSPDVPADDRPGDPPVDRPPPPPPPLSTPSPAAPDLVEAPCEEGATSAACEPTPPASSRAPADRGTVRTADSADGLEAVPSEDEDPPEEPDDERLSAVCGFTSDYVGPYAAALVQRIRGDVRPSCAWAENRTTVELGPLAKVFTPIAWRLGRDRVQDAVHCLLACGGVAALGDAGTSPALGPALQVATLAPAPPPVDPRTLGPFHRAVCDRLHAPQPSYIGLPRWMPGPLLVSETLRAGYGCPPPAAEPALPLPLAVAIAPVPESEPPAPDGDAGPAVAEADRRLDAWPPASAGLDAGGPALPEPSRETGAAQTGPAQTDPLETAPAETPAPAPDRELDIADATPPAGAATPSSVDEPSASAPERTFTPTPSQVHWLQSALTVDNRDPGPLDGRLGPRTMAAIQSWRRDQDDEVRARTGPLTEAEFQAIIEAFGERFHQLHARMGGS